MYGYTDILFNYLEHGDSEKVYFVELPVLTCLDRLGSLLFFRIYLIRTIVILVTRELTAYFNQSGFCVKLLNQFGPTVAEIFR